MLFNSPEFLFLFLPVTWGVFLLCRRQRRLGALLGWMLVASLVFYAAWDPRFLLLLVGSMLLNYGVGIQIKRHARSAAGGAWLFGGVAANLVVLGWFKYLNFAAENLSRWLDLGWQVEPLVLPLAISFFTFQQIAYLVDQRRGLLPEHGLRSYMLFVTFFPQLIAGPIVHFRELEPQFGERLLCRPLSPMAALGITALAVGLSKKVLIADELAKAATPVFLAADRGHSVSFLEAWLGALAYAFQIYFDFSGYSDMAVGLALLFGISLPVNFLSPYKSQSITEFWRRWHITLSHFLRDYLYIPLGGNRFGPVRQRMNLMITMLLGGIWHGAGWNFIIWGGLHGIFLVGHQSVRDRSWFRVLRERRWWPTTSWCTTFLLVVLAWVPFRAGTTEGTMELLGSMMFRDGVDVPLQLVPTLQSLGVPAAEMTAGTERFIPVGLPRVLFLLPLAAFLCVRCPNTAEICGLVQSDSAGWRFRPTWYQACAIGVMLSASLLAIGSPSEFLYFNF